MENENLRPKGLKNFFGQKNIVDRTIIALKAAKIKGDAFPHVIMSGPPGLGKTTLAAIIANEMDVPLLKVLSTSVKNDAVVESILAKIPMHGYDAKTGKIEDGHEIIPTVIFMDEIHRLPTQVIETLYTVLEDNEICLKRMNYDTRRFESQMFWVPKFTLVGATNYLGSLPKPFVDRFRLHFNFEAYESDEIVKVVLRSAAASKKTITMDGAKEIAAKSRGIPRLANHFLEKTYDNTIALTGKIETRFTKDHVCAMFVSEEIDEAGLNRRDRALLTYLAKLTKPIGAKSLAQAIDDDEETLVNTIEPYLVRQDFIVRTGRGRLITEKGQEHIGIYKRNKLHPKLNSKG